MKLFETLVPSDFRASIRGPLRRFYFCTFFNCVGSGLILSLFVVYLHNVRHFSISFATLLLAISAIAGLATSPLWGTLTDRVGPLPVMFWCSFTDAAALVYWAFAHTRVEAIIAALALNILGGGGWGPMSTMLSRLIAPELRQRAFGVNFMLVNLGIGFGGLVSATIVDIARPGTFELLYCLDALVGVATAFLYLTLRGHGHAELDEESRAKRESEGWLVVMRDTRLLRYVVGSVVLMIGGYGSLDAGLSLFVVNKLHVSVHAIGLIFFFNTSTIVLAQLGVLNRIEGRSRTRVLGVVSACWALFWIILQMTLNLPVSVSIAMLCFAMIIFAIGETMLQPVGSALVNEIAPEHLRGRYNAAAGISWGVSGSLAPAITALYFSLHAGSWWPLGTAITALVGGAMMMNLRRHISPAADGRVVTHALP